MDALVRKVVDCLELRRFGARDDHFADRATSFIARNEIDFLQPLLGHREVADGDIREAFVEVGQQLVARGRRDVDRQRPLAELLRILDVEVALPVAHQLDRNASLTALVAGNTASARKARRRGSSVVPAFDRNRRSMACWRSGVCAPRTMQATRRTPPALLSWLQRERSGRPATRMQGIPPRPGHSK